jgi:outer membrane protein assembly factor BamB
MPRGVPGGLLALALMVLLAGCSWFEAEDPPLPGERIAVLDPETELEANPQIADREVTLAQPYVNDSWAQPGGGPTHVLYHLQLPESLARSWQAQVGTPANDRQQITAQPAIAGGRVFTLDAEATVTAFDAGAGERIWRRDLAEELEDEGVFGGGVAVADGRVFVTTGLGRVFALDAGSGEVLWEHVAGAPMRAGPAVRDGRVYAVTLVNETIALSADSGEELWSHQGIEEQAGLLGSATPAVTASSVIVAYSSGELTALLPENGRPLWSDSLAGFTRADAAGDLSDVRAMPAVDRNRVYALSNANRMVAIDTRRGARAWEREIGGTEMPWVGGDYVFLITTRNELLALDRDGGRIRWVTELARWRDPDDRDGPIVWHGPVLAGDRLVLAGSHGEAVSVSPYSGEVLGRIDLPGPSAVSPVVADGTLYFLTDTATLVAYR